MAVIRSLEVLRKEGGALTVFTFDYVGDYDPVRDPHRRDWARAEDHWQRTNFEFSGCSDIAPATVTSDEARRRVERASALFLHVLALDGVCWACF